MFLKLRHRLVDFRHPLVMGILNVTDDSFYAASRLQSSCDLLAAMRRLVAEGADILDVGACSTRPLSEPVDADTEAARLQEALPLIRKELPDIPLSVDTFRPGLVELCARYDVDIINDISGGSGEMYSQTAKHDMGYVLTHNAPFGSPSEVVDYFQRRIDLANRAGVKDIILDPGFGFGKGIEENYSMLDILPLLKQTFAMPVMVGISRKRMIFNVLNITQDEALAGTIAANTVALTKGADIIRVHDVKEAVQTVMIFGHTGKLNVCN